MPIDLHFICPLRQNWKALGENRFQTGNWYVSEAVATEAVGGRIYLHEKQSAEAWHGGTIVEMRPSELPDRYVFTYVVDAPFRVKCKTGWGQEKAIIRR